MTTDVERFLRCFIIAKKVTHLYWLHTDGDYPEIGRIRVENVERTVERITGIQINKKVVDFKGRLIRGLTERYHDRAEILIRKDQPIEWQKYSAIKEYSHILYDLSDEDMQPDPIETLRSLVSDDPFELDAGFSAFAVSERFAEVLALEIIYPLEFRAEDRDRLNAGAEIGELVELRHVPAVHIERSSQPKAIESCRHIWKLLSDIKPT